MKNDTRTWWRKRWQKEGIEFAKKHGPFCWQRATFDGGDIFGIYGHDLDLVFEQVWCGANIGGSYDLEL